MIDETGAPPKPPGTTHAWVDFDGKVLKWLILQDGVYRFWNGNVLAAIQTEMMQGHGTIEAV